MADVRAYKRNRKLSGHYNLRVQQNNLRLLRAAKRWSQEQVAKKMGLVSRYRFWQLENEIIEPTDKEVAKLVRIFGCSAEEIFPPRKKLIGVKAAAAEARA